MSYYTLGTNCKPLTVALTSNTKFLPPLNRLYTEVDHTFMTPDEKNYYRFDDFGAEDVADDLLDTNPQLELQGAPIPLQRNPCGHRTGCCGR